MMRVKDVPPAIRRLFPWALFLFMAAVLAFAAMAEARGADMPAQSFCEKVRAYLATHSTAEARAEAVKLHLPAWVIRKAEKCL